MYQRPAPLWVSKQSFYTDLALFVLGVSGSFSVNLMGSLPGCEVVLLPLLPVLLVAQGHRAFRREHLWFLVLVVGWLLNTLLSDAYNAIGFFNRAKGTARVVFFALDFLALAVLLNYKTRRFIVFSLAFAIVLLAGSWSFRGDMILQWKFGISEGSAVVAMLVSSYYFARKRYKTCLGISLLWAGLNLHYGFRSQLAIHLIAAALTLPLLGESRKKRKGATPSQSPLKIVLTLALAGLAAYAANASLRFATKSGFFDESTAAKFAGQDKGDYGVLLGGRPETPVAIQAIIDSPIMGHGSFAEGEKYLWMKQAIQYEHGYSDTDIPEEAEYNTIPTHSHLTLAWVEGGILGGVFWIYVFVLTLRALLKLSFLRPALSPFYSYVLTGFLWDILYSPFGSVNRMWAAFYILMCYHILAAAAAKTLKMREQNRDRLRAFNTQGHLSRPLLPRLPFPTA